MSDKTVLETQKGNTRDLGITIVIIYIMLFIYVLLSVYYNKKLGFSLTSKKSSFTLHDLLYNSDNIGSIFLVILLGSLVLWLLIEQRFFKSIKGIVTIVVWIISILGVLSLFKYKNKYLISIIYIFLTSFTILTIETYKDSFSRNTLNELTVISYILVVLNIFILLLFLINNNKPQSTYHRLINDIIGLTNVIYIFSLILYLYYLSIHPHLETNQVYQSVVIRNMI